MLIPEQGLILAKVTKSKPKSFVKYAEFNWANCINWNRILLNSNKSEIKLKYLSN